MTAEISELSYEQARDELVQVVTTLERGGITLEESLQLWERGEALAERCESWLVRAKERLEGAKDAETTAESEAPDTSEGTNGEGSFTEDAF